MKKNLFALLLIAILITAFFVPSVNNVAEAASESDPIAIVLSGNFDEQSKDLTVTATVPKNTAIIGLTLTLVYNKEILEFKGYDYDKNTFALGTLNLVATGNEVEADEFKFNWFSAEGELVNDNRSGTLLVLHFHVKENVPLQETTVTFKCNQASDAVYISGTTRKNKGISIASLTKQVYNNSEDVLPPEEGPTENVDETGGNAETGLSTTQRIVILCAIAVAVLAVVIVFIVIGNKRKNNNSNEVNREKCQEDSEVNQ